MLLPRPVAAAFGNFANDVLQIIRKRTISACVRCKRLGARVDFGFYLRHFLGCRLKQLTPD